jgi:hypothetical protein
MKENNEKSQISQKSNDFAWSNSQITARRI